MARTPRRILAGILVVLGGVLMWFAPESLGWFGPKVPGTSIAGIVMLCLGVAVEVAGIALEHVDERRKRSAR